MKKEIRERLRKECAEFYGDDLADYVVGKTSQVVEVHGMMVHVERRRIEKFFCFGYSDDSTGEDFDLANSMAHDAQTNRERFKSENMKTFRRDIEEIRENLSAIHESETLPYTVVVIAPYPNCRMGEVISRRSTDVIEEFGPCFVRDLPGKTLPVTNLYIPTKEELTAVLSAYEAAAREHEKKVDAYLRRYGLSKVQAWSYWRDE